MTMLATAGVVVPVLGKTAPRVWTPPLCDLDDPDNSWGYWFIEFCEAIGWPLDPWQEWLAIHLGELRPDGTPRFRKAVILVARQSGKSLFARLLILYWMFVERVPEILATSTDRAAAKRFWRKVVDMAEGDDDLSTKLPARHTALQIGEEDFWNSHGAHYRFAAPTRRAGRGDTLNRVLLDELREHRTRDTWDAIVPAMNAVPDALLVCITNEGDAESTVLHEEYDAALDYIETGKGDSLAFLAAWSAPPGADPEDVEALAQANPGLGRRIELDALLGQASTAKRAGGETLARFRIEIMCQRVSTLDSAIDPDAWTACGTDEPLDLAGLRSRVALCLDVALDGSHAMLAAACVVAGVAHVEIYQAWEGFGCTQALRRELPGIVAKVKPRALGWFPAGPAASVAAAIGASRTAGVRWPPVGVKVEELKGEATAVCMGLAEQVTSQEVRHPKDPLLNAQVAGTQKLPRGDGWVFTRRGHGPIDATYALAGAVHLARTIPALAPV